MKSEPFLDRKALLANVTLIGHFARVRPHVHCQTAHLDKLSPAHTALVRLVASVFAGMLLHVIFSGKRLAAVRAFEPLKRSYRSILISTEQKLNVELFVCI